MMYSSKHLGFPVIERDTLVGMITLAFFLLIVTFVNNPFSRIWATCRRKILQSMVRPANAFLIYPPDGLG